MEKLRNSFCLDTILSKASVELPLRREEIAFLLSLKDSRNIARLFQTARLLRQRHFGKKIFLYGFIYFSTYCRNDCRFCASRRTNRFANRYRKTGQNVLEAARQLAESGVHCLDLTMGEDPLFYQEKEGSFDAITEMAQQVKGETGLPLMISPGAVPLSAMRRFAHANLDWYACYQETYDRDLFEWLRPGQSYEQRLQNKASARQCGMLIEEGILSGVGESIDDVAASIGFMQQLDVHQARVMSFVPQYGTPMADRHSPPRLRELVTISVLRLVFPDRLIPASLDIDGIRLLQARLNAGANVITSLIPPHMGLSGVSQSTLGIHDGSRTVQGVAPLLKKAGLEAASADDYRNWVKKERDRLSLEFSSYEART